MDQTSNDRIVRLNELPQGKHTFTFRLTSEYLSSAEGSEIRGGDVAVEALLTLRENDYSLHLQAHGTVLLTCDRCLGEMAYSIDADDEILSDEGDEQEDGNVLDLRWLAYETITIHLPLVHSHPEGECLPDMQQLLHEHLCSAAEEPDME